MTSGNPEPIEIHVGNGNARVEGTRGPASASVVLLRRSGTDWVLQTPAGYFPNPPRDGRFLIEAVPPGEYLAFAWDNAGHNISVLPYNTEEFHRKFGSYLERFTIGDAETVKLTLPRLLPAAALEAY